MKYRNSRSKEAALQHIEEYRNLKRKLGIILDDVEYIFFHLPPESFERLMECYREAHGEKAYQYALDTYEKWKIRSVKLSGQTATRLLNLVPPLLNPKERYKLVEKLCKNYARKETFRITIESDYPEQGLTQLNAAFEKASNFSVLKFIPQDTLETIKWLNSNSATATRMVLTEIDRANHENISRLAKEEVSRTTSAVYKKQVKSAIHEITLPYATIVVAIEKPRGFFGKVIRHLIG